MRAHHQCIARIFTLANRGYSQTLRQDCWQILQRMNGNIDATIEQRIFELLREDTLASNHRQGIALHVASCFYNFNASIETSQAIARVFSLPECEFRTARTDDELSRHWSLLLESKRIFRQLHCFGLAGLVEATHLVENGMGDLVDGRHEQRLDRGFLFLCQWAEPFALARQFCPSNVLHVLPQSADVWSKVHQTKLLLKLHHFRLHDQFSSFSLTLALANV